MACTDCAAILLQHCGCFGTNIPREVGPNNDDDDVRLYDEMEVSDEDVTDMEEDKHLFEYEISTH